MAVTSARLVDPDEGEHERHAGGSRNPEPLEGDPPGQSQGEEREGGGEDDQPSAVRPGAAPPHGDESERSDRGHGGRPSSAAENSEIASSTVSSRFVSP